MKIYSIKDGGVILEGPYTTIRKATEKAVQEGIDLSFANFRKADFKDAELDGISAPGACFWGADLSGANVSDAYLHDCDFRLSLLKRACLSDSIFSHCDFRGASFASVILDGADFSGSQLNCPQFLKQDFSQIQSLRNVTYHHLGEVACRFDRAPVYVRGLGADIVFLDHHIKIGETVVPISECPEHLKDIMDSVIK